MKKQIIMLPLMVILFALTACGHTHVWLDATCTAGNVCEECGEIEGEALGHSWNKATCLKAMICSVCGETEGIALGHTWAEATCARAKLCKVCGETEGEALGHTWIEATCTIPKTCSVCGESEGETLAHDTPALTCIDDAVCTQCNQIITAPGHTWAEANCTIPKTCSVCGETEGEALGHTTTSGICTRCNVELYEKVTGNGDDVISGIEVGDGIYRVHFTNTGRSNFVVKSYDANDDRELMVNEIGAYDGYVLLLGTAPYIFEISSSGNWSYTIEKIEYVTDSSFVGKGDYVTGLFSATSGAWQFTHNGKSNFAVKCYTTDGVDLLVNEIGKYDGKKMVTVPSGSYVMLEIIADGSWTAAPVE